MGGESWERVEWWGELDFFSGLSIKATELAVGADVFSARTQISRLSEMAAPTSNGGGTNTADVALPTRLSKMNLAEAEEDDQLQLTCTEEDWLNEEMDDVEEEDAAETAAAVPDLSRQECEVDPYVPISPDYITVVDMQMVFHRGLGFLVKEFAFRKINSLSISAMNMIHDVDDVPAHVVEPAADGIGHYDVYTGLKLEDGEFRYDDRHIANVLLDSRVVIVKGANKKKALQNVYERLKCSKDSQPIKKPIIVNVDAHTADDEDRIFCRTNNMHLATFSFPFVYENLGVFEKMIFGQDDVTVLNPGDMLYVTNVLSKDPRYDFSGKGRIVCVCYSDHSRGGTETLFDKNQRCSMLNMSILDHLWLRRQELLFKELVKNTRREGKRPRSETTSTGRRVVKGGQGGYKQKSDRRRRYRHHPYGRYRDDNDRYRGYDSQNYYEWNRHDGQDRDYDVNRQRAPVNQRQRDACGEQESSYWMGYDDHNKLYSEW